MITDFNLVCVLIWAVIGAIAYFVTVSRQWCGVGLTLAFFLNMTLIHWFSGIILLLPWYMPWEYYSTVHGFRVSTLGIIAFAVGCFGIAPVFFRVPHKTEEFVMSESAPKIFCIFLAVGLTSVLLGAAGLSKVATLSAFVTSGQAFTFAALGFGIWQSYLSQNRKQLYILLSTILIFPVLTLMLQGFLGFGVGYAIIVLCFFIAVYRPRMRACLLALPVAYLALSFYVTYMRDRAELRAVVWNAGKFETRLLQAEKMVQQFEWFDPWNHDHLHRVDIRLNYNWLIGAAMSHLQLTKGFGNGETLWMSVVTLIPRAVWPDKPIQAGSMDFATRYAGVVVPQNTSIGMGLIFEFYVNYGEYGVFIGMLIMGILVGFADRKAGAELRWGSPIAFARWLLIGTFLLIVGGSLIEIVPGIILAMIWAAALKFLCGNILTDNVPEPAPVLDIDATHL
jgi:hypothetical protein